MIVLLLATALAGDWEMAASVGAEVDRSPHGTFDLALRKDALTLGIYTDTLEVRYAPSFTRGRAWVAARAELAAAGLMITRWEDGQLTPDNNLFAFYEGVEGGGVLYLPAGLYVGAEAKARYWHFLATPSTTREVPGGRAVLSADALLGFYHPNVHVWLRGGTDWSQRWMPHLHVELTTDLPWIARPHLEIRAGLADGVDEITATRLGGLNPYVIPLAGAAWAEFYVEDYVAVRAGVRAGPEDWFVGATWDVALYDGKRAVGFAAHARYERFGRWIETSLGWAPWLPRQGLVAAALWFRVGADFGKGLGPRRPAEQG